MCNISTCILYLYAIRAVCTPHVSKARYPSAVVKRCIDPNSALYIPGWNGEFLYLCAYRLTYRWIREILQISSNCHGERYEFRSKKNIF